MRAFTSYDLQSVPKLMNIGSSFFKLYIRLNRQHFFLDTGGNSPIFVVLHAEFSAIYCVYTAVIIGGQIWNAAVHLSVRPISSVVEI